MDVQPGWTFAAAATQLGLTRGRVSQLVKQGKLATFEVHGRSYISPDAIREYRESLRAGKNMEEVSHAGA